MVIRSDNEAILAVENEVSRGDGLDWCSYVEVDAPRMMCLPCWSVLSNWFAFVVGGVM